MNKELPVARANGPYKIRVEMYFESPDDDGIMEYCGNFFWGTHFQRGHTLLFEHPQAAFKHIRDNEYVKSISGFEFRFRVQPDLNKRFNPDAF